jgi:hypothetical protein
MPTLSFAPVARLLTEIVGKATTTGLEGAFHALPGQLIQIEEN